MSQQHNDHKTPQEAKDRIAKREGYQTWDDMSYTFFCDWKNNNNSGMEDASFRHDFLSLENDAMEEYAAMRLKGKEQELNFLALDHEARKFEVQDLQKQVAELKGDFQDRHIPKQFMDKLIQSIESKEQSDVKAGRVYNRKIDETEDLEIITVEHWLNVWKNKVCSTLDGSGYWVKDGFMCDEDEVFSSEPEDATHVAWYNK